MRNKNYIMSISRQPSSTQIRIDQKQQKNVEYFIFGCSLITYDALWRREMKSGIALAKSTFYKKKSLFTSQLDLNLRNKILQLEHSFV